MTNQTTSLPPLPVTNKPHSSRFSRWRRHRVAYLFVLPYFLVMLAFGLGPGLYALLISFADFRTGLPKYFAAGFNNYLAVFKDFRFTFTFANIGKFLAISVPLGIAMVVILAILLQMRPGRLTTALRTLYFVSGAVTGPILVLVVIFMLDPSISPFQALLKDMGYKLTNDVIYGGSLMYRIFCHALQPSMVAASNTSDGRASNAPYWIAIHKPAPAKKPMRVKIIGKLSA